MQNSRPEMIEDAAKRMPFERREEKILFKWCEYGKKNDNKKMLQVKKNKERLNKMLITGVIDALNDKQMSAIFSVKVHHKTPSGDAVFATTFM